MIRVELVRVGDYLVPRTFSDAWNMRTCGIGPIRWDRNQAGVKAIRRRLAALGLSLTVVRNATVQVHPTDAEAKALGLVNIRRLTARAA